MPTTKAHDVIATSVVFNDPAAALFRGMQQHLLLLTGDSDRDIDLVEMFVEPGATMFAGSWSGRNRLITGFVVTPANEAEVAIVTTKGRREADAGLLVVNEPFDNRVRTLYKSMGFKNGERLALDDIGALSTAFAYVEQAYKHASLSTSIPLSSPPLPF